MTGRARQTRARRRSSKASVPAFRRTSPTGSASAADGAPAQAGARRRARRDDSGRQFQPRSRTRGRHARAAGRGMGARAMLARAGVDDAGRVRSLAARALSSTLTDPAQAVGEWVMQTGEVFAAQSGDDRRSRRTRVKRARRCWVSARMPGQTVGALVALDRAPRARQPRFDRRHAARCSRRSSRGRSRSTTPCGCSAPRRCRSPTT